MCPISDITAPRATGCKKMCFCSVPGMLGLLLLHIYVFLAHVKVLKYKWELLAGKEWG